MRGIGQWASGPESWGPNWDHLEKKKKKLNVNFSPIKMHENVYLWTIYIPREPENRDKPEN